MPIAPKSRKIEGSRSISLERIELESGKREHEWLHTVGSVHAALLRRVTVLDPSH